MVGQVIALIICIILSGFFSSSEIAFSVVNKLRLKKAAESGDRKAARALKISEDYDETISMLLFANNFVNIAASAIATIISLHVFSNLSRDNAATISSIIIFVLVLTFGEVIPKIISLKFNYQLVKLFAFPLHILEIILRPIVFTVNKLVQFLSVLWVEKEKMPSVTEDELVEMVETIEEEGFINEKQGELLKSAIDFCDTAAFEIMTPRVDVFAYDIDDPIEDLMQNSDIFMYSRIPVYEESIDNVIGILKTKTLLKMFMADEKGDIRSLLEPPIYVHKSRQISTILKEFKDTHNHLAIIKDEFGGTMGIITLEDIVEELVGEIWDEMDEIEEEYQETSEGVFIIDGSMNIDDFFELVEIDEEIDSDYTTVGGWCIEVLERFAKVGDTFDYKNLTIKVLKVDEFTVEQIRVEVEEKEDEED